MAFVRAIGRISDAFGAIAMAQVGALMGLIVYEVVCRFGFNAPNIWGFDVTYMFAGTMFYLGAAYTLKEKAHVKIDFLSERFPPGVAFVIHVAFTAGLFLPMLAFILFSAFDKAWRAFATQQTDYTSPWAPVMWPFYTTICVGLLVLWLQALADLVESILLRFRPRTPSAHSVGDS